MSIAVLPDLVLPNRVIEAGVSGKRMRRNSRVTTDSGATSINIVWTHTLLEFELGIVPMSRGAWQTVIAFHEITEGGAYGFLMEDPADMNATDSPVTALTSTTFQLQKRYTDQVSGRSKDRKITRPRSSPLAVFVSGVPLGGGAYTLNTTTGVITIPSAPAANTVTWTGRFYVPVHFQADSIDWELAVAGPDPDARFVAGPSVVLQEIRE